MRIKRFALDFNYVGIVSTIRLKYNAYMNDELLPANARIYRRTLGDRANAKTNKR